MQGQRLLHTPFWYCGGKQEGYEEIQVVIVTLMGIGESMRPSLVDINYYDLYLLDCWVGLTILKVIRIILSLFYSATLLSILFK